MNRAPKHFTPRTKIVATVGPSCNGEDQLAQLIQEGVDVFRVNTAHGTRAEHDAIVANVRSASQAVGRLAAVLVDLAGPKIRLGELVEDPTVCDAGEPFRFVRESSGSPRDLTSGYERLVDELDVGDRVMLADGTVSMQVVETSADAACCKVTAAGVIRSRQGINLPGTRLSVTAPTEQDIDNARWAAGADVDFLGLSFVRSADNVRRLRQVLCEEGSEAQIVAKIEKQEALDALQQIVSVADAVMVARGDLGVETDISEMPMVQKRIISLCLRAHKPVIVATQMLDSMTTAAQPTRAEATDVANAILDGADACMLSGETAVGVHPQRVVQMMQRILLATEKTLRRPEVPHFDATLGVAHPITTAVVRNAGRIAEDVDARLVVVATRSGATALVKSNQRDVTASVAVSDCERTLRRTCLYWGIAPLPGAPVEEGPRLREFIEAWGREAGLLQAGDRVVFVTGSHFMPQVHNQVVVYELP